MVEMIELEIVDRSPSITYDDIAGLDFAKKTIFEIIVWPMLRPDIFNGLRAPPKVAIISLRAKLLIRIRVFCCLVLLEQEKL